MRKRPLEDDNAASLIDEIHDGLRRIRTDNDDHPRPPTGELNDGPPPPIECIDGNLPALSTDELLDDPPPLNEGNDDNSTDVWDGPPPCLEEDGTLAWGQTEVCADESHDSTPLLSDNDDDDDDDDFAMPSAVKIIDITDLEDDNEHARSPRTYPNDADEHVPRHALDPHNPHVMRNKLMGTILARMSSNHLAIFHQVLLNLTQIGKDNGFLGIPVATGCSGSGCPEYVLQDLIDKFPGVVFDFRLQSDIDILRQDGV